MTGKYIENKPFIFISYKHDPADEAVVKKTISELRRRYGFNIWYDAELTAGTNWDEIALRRVRSSYCKMVLFFASNAALTSKPISEELATAKKWKKMIIPISFENKPFSDILMMINEEYNESDPEKVDIADRIIEEHLDDKLTYIVADVDSAGYYNDIFRTVQKNAPEIIESAEEADQAKENVSGSPAPAGSAAEGPTTDAAVSAGPVLATETPQPQRRGPGRPPKNVQPVSAPQPKPAPAPQPEPEAAPVLEGELPPVTLGEIRRRFLTEEFCLKVQDLRKNRLPHGGKGAIDYGMAAILGGCNNVKQPWQLNYYNFAIADYTKKTESKTAATWTWSSNCRKLIGMAGSGQIDSERNSYFESLSEDTTIGQIVDGFERAETEVFRTSKNPLVVQCLRMFAALLQETAGT